MPTSISRLIIEDQLRRYHPYTVDYRAPGSNRYKDFSPLDPLDPNNIIQKAENLKWDGNRDELAATVSRFLSELGAPEASLENAKKLSELKSVCIVTGHQPALVGGPLFLMLKIASVIRLCEMLNGKSDVTFIPVYWNGSEEHNRAEIGRISLFDNEHDLIHLSLPPDDRSRMASQTPAEEAEPLLIELGKMLPQTEFLPDLMEKLRNAAVNDLGEMQSRLMLEWFGKRGLVIVEPKILRQLSTPVIRQALETAAETHECLAEDTREMEEIGYSPQLPLHERERTTVFYIENGERFRIRLGGKGFTLEKRNKSFTKEELFRELSEKPENFSPSAALRPIVQCKVMPVAGYVAGGGELAYHFQLRKLFEHFQTELPLMIPRAAGTVLKKSLLKTMGKLELPETQLLSSAWDWKNIEEASANRTGGQGKAFKQFNESLFAAFDCLKKELSENGLQNLNELDKERERFLGRLGGLEKRFLQQDPATGENPRRQYFRLRKFILPGESYQELSAWTVYFVALFGENIINEITDQTMPLDTGHHLFIAG